jgi:hypothetical protein
MKLKYRGIKVFVIFLFIGISVGACSSGSYINLRYQLPPASDQLKGKTVFLEFKDMRTDKAFLSETAKKDFENFAGLFSLHLTNENMKDDLVGGFNVESLFKEALKRRLGSIGVNVTEERKKDIPVMELVLNKFFLDYRERKWITDISFQVRLIKEKSKIATETVSGASESIKIWGWKNAEKNIGEIFTDCFNRLNIDKLFQQAGL